MNARAKKKADKKKKEALNKILDAVIDINGLQASCKENTGDHTTAFLDFMGHTGDVSVYFYGKGWEPCAFSSDRHEACVFNLKELEELLKIIKDLRW